MSLIDETDELFARYLEFDAKLWARFVPTGLPVKATYYCDAYVPAAAGALHRFLLIVTKRRVVLEAGPISTGHGLIFSARSTSREIAFEASDLDCVGENWPSLTDPLMRKAHEVAVLCGHKFAPSPFKAALRRGNS
ncbi:hypothetical protein EZ313_22020 [Ramlibacter henchirensis]|uniref:Uncharacterized protein n=1 Tax=Ramlibacter henchirensis TaxID=204072 RepID=A0A4Z0BIW0_9BURK|nr:hypothetical protein [Ramlibacter henchirensis]TFY99246.1 hypothetical protein EZ313_22020 [Ramlibacter henchirensis]